MKRLFLRVHLCYRLLIHWCLSHNILYSSEFDDFQLLTKTPCYRRFRNLFDKPIYLQVKNKLPRGRTLELLVK